MKPHYFSKIRPLLTSALLAASLWLPQAVSAQSNGAIPDYVIAEYGAPPPIPTGPLSREVKKAIKTSFIVSMRRQTWGRDQTIALEELVASKDVRLAWIVSDLMRFINDPGLHASLADAAARLFQKDLGSNAHWGSVTDHLIAWDIPAPPDYLKTKRSIFIAVIPGWERIFVEGDIDWRLVSWGGVMIDNRPHDATDERCNCIPAADNPKVSSAEEATWLKDDDIVFGIGINGEYRAYPRRIMEVREMVNDTLGGRDLGIPYCTLCGAAQAYFTDQLPAGTKRPILRTSGLLSRSNKVMYDLNTYSVFDTFLGKAVTGPLARKGLELKQATVITTDWGTWKREHPETTVLLERYALGRDPDFRNGRDANGPIFPIGDVDPRLPVHEDVIGAITASGKPVAFQRSRAFLALRQGKSVRYENVSLRLEAGGIRAVGDGNIDLGSHQAFWFAWSQFHPDTVLWTQ